MARKEWELLFNLVRQTEQQLFQYIQAAQSALVETQGKISS